MSNDKCCGEKHSWERRWGVTVQGGFISHGASRRGRPKVAFEQRPEGSERIPDGSWGKFIPAADSKSQVPEREASSASSV